ncbi:MAG TPA: energy-coupling factor transporter ATPase [Firmicutes bacterium]|nr:energy-coupling factor transporter ATPase [Bacillota bacterium]
MLEARGLYFSYQPEEGGAPFALSGINLVVRRGEYLSIIGPSGSGKTTLLKNFNGLLKPTSGEVLVNGRSTSHETNLLPIRQVCGMIFQNPDNQLVATTVEEEIAFGLENYRENPARIRELVDWSMEKLNISHLAEHPPHLLSGGQKQKVAIAGVLAMRPQCLLADEPTSMLDPSGRQELLEVVQSLHRELGLTVIQVTHFMEEAALSERVLLLHRGKILADGPPEEVLTDLDRLRSAGLTSNVAVELAALLRKDGVRLPQGIVKNQELVGSLCSLRRKS